ncbi:MAG: tRNA glutamyl-Q(34) synthetase GluQRS [Deltaproteobacteria bacterium]|nr:tRNA glutamyl-Q(34) synthetase GluQRS [Deltaproteobacteria bacterium]
MSNTGPISSTTIVGRLAPSPTGHLHLGHARSFLIAWWHARSRGGRIVLRLEDLDVERVKPSLIEATIEDLRWLGLDWDDEPYVQSRSAADIDAAAQALLDRGLVYPCVCTRKEILAAQSAPHAGETSTVYPGICRGRFKNLADAESASGRPAALRFIVPDKLVHIEDEFQGVREFDARRQIGDFPIARSLGLPAYQLAVVVDDVRQGVTEIVRGADLLESCARQWLLQEALGYPHPRWWHIPLVTDASGRRLAKRSDDVSLARLRGAGVDAWQIVAWVARGAGIDIGDRANARDLISSFEMMRLHRSEVRVTPADLAAFGL